MLKFGIIAALPREIAGLVQGVMPEPVPKRAGVHVYRLPSAIVVCAGMGGARVSMAVEAAMESGDISMLISAGLAGSCDPQVRAGTAMEVGLVVDSSSGERYQAGTGEGSTLVTSHAIASVREKQRLFASYGAGMVDMEAATVARLAQVHGIGFRAIKGISDGHDFELSSLARFAGAHGQFRTRAFGLHTALRPHHWRRTMQLGAASQRALRALTGALKCL